MFFFSVFTKVSRIVCFKGFFIPEIFCLPHFRKCDNLFSFNEIFTGQTLNQDWGYTMVNGGHSVNLRPYDPLNSADILTKVIINLFT